jgi:hypothetical protein
MRPKEIAAQNYLYSPKKPDGARDNTVEQRLSELETVLGEIWPAVTTGTVSLESPGLRKGLSLFLSTMYLRNPQRLSDHRYIHRAVSDILGGRSLSPESVNRSKQPSRQEAGRFEQAFVSALVEDGRKLAELLLPKRWAVVVSDSPAFATCDAPVVVQGIGNAPFRFGIEGTTVYFPLSPSRFLIIDDEKLPGGYYASKPGFAEAMNYQTWTAADRYLLSSEPSDTVLKGIMAFVDEYGLS